MGQQKYFSLSMEAARTIVSRSEDPDLLGAYVVLHRFLQERRAATDKPRVHTAAGAKSIRTYLGVSDYRSKHLLQELLCLADPLSGEPLVLEPAGFRTRNAATYRLREWPGARAYVPDLFVTPEDGQASLLRTLCDRTGNPETLRDALLVLLHLYATVDYGHFFGGDPSHYFYQRWDDEGFRTTENMDFELGRQESYRSRVLWLVAPPKESTWWMPAKLSDDIFGESGQDERAWKALFLLLDLQLVIPVVSVEDRRRTYPLWVFSRAYRDTLESMGIAPNLGKYTQALANDTGIDPDNWLIRDAVDHKMEGIVEGTRLFYCVGNKPTVRSLLVPRLHAPTPRNLQAFEQMAQTTSDLRKELRAASLSARRGH